MVSFVCDTCQETLKKQKLDAHKSRCYNAVYSCIDCSKTFQGTDYKAHTSCITEVEKYQKPKLQAAKTAIPAPKSKPIVEEIKATETPVVTPSKKSKKSPAEMVLSILKKVLTLSDLIHTIVEKEFVLFKSQKESSEKGCCFGFGIAHADFVHSPRSSFAYNLGIIMAIYDRFAFLTDRDSLSV